MGYRKIPNLYKDQRILMFKEVFAMEKIHGTSTHVSWKNGEVSFYSGGIQPHSDFVDIFNISVLQDQFEKLGHDEVVVFGEGYGGKCQKMSETYGEGYKFVAFEVKIGDCWLEVPDAFDVAHNQIGLDFVPYERIECDIDLLDEERNKPSVQAQKCGCGDDKLREGIVIRPPFEVRLNNGERLLAKHKNKEFQERENQPSPKDFDPEKAEKRKEAESIAKEWVNEMRLAHVLDAIKSQSEDEPRIEDTGKVISAMTDDVFTEADGEIEGDRRAIKKAIGSRTAELFHRWLGSKIESC